MVSVWTKPLAVVLVSVSLFLSGCSEEETIPEPIQEQPSQGGSSSSSLDQRLALIESKTAHTEQLVGQLQSEIKKNEARFQEVNNHFRVTADTLSGLLAVAERHRALMDELKNKQATTTASLDETRRYVAEFIQGGEKLITWVGTLEKQLKAGLKKFDSVQTDVAKVSEMTRFIRVAQVDSRPAVLFEGVNVYIRNTEQDADPSAANGLGNLILGFNRPATDANDVALRNNRTGSHNLIIGDGHSYTSTSGLIAGYGNSVYAPFAAITGGAFNSVTAPYAVISGGADIRLATENGWAAGVFRSEKGNGKIHGTATPAAPKAPQAPENDEMDQSRSADRMR